MTAGFLQTLVLTFVLSVSFGQDPVQTKNYRTLRYYQYGTVAYGGCNETCEEQISKNYSFVWTDKGGLTISSGQERRWTKHNNRVSLKMEARYGANWWDKFITEINACCKE